MPNEDLLQEITSVWHLEKNVIHKISDILLYMNKNFVPKMRNYPTVEAMQTNEFKKNVERKYKNVKCILSNNNIGMGAGNNLAIKNLKKKICINFKSRCVIKKKYN